jgi:Nuclease subunit of the excinuclease complex
VGYISKEDYGQIIDNVIEFLSGETRPIQRELERKMKDAAEGERFEEAARYRNRLFAVRHLVERQAADRRSVGSVDVIGLAVERDRRLVRVREIFLALLLRSLLRAANARDFFRRRIQSQRAFAAIEHNACAIRNFERSRFDAGESGMPNERARIAPCEVAPPRVWQIPYARAIERGRVGGREIFGDENCVGRIIGRLCFLAGKNPEHAQTDIAQIVCALREQRITQRRESIGVSRKCFLPAKLRAFSFRNRRIDDLE